MGFHLTFRFALQVLQLLGGLFMGLHKKCLNCVIQLEKTEITCTNTAYRHNQGVSVTSCHS